VVVLFSLMFGVVLTGCGAAQSTPSGGDSGGTVLRELSPVTRAVPQGSTVVDAHKNDASWSPACPDNPSGKAGWSGVEVFTIFKSMDTSQAIASAVGTTLTGEGWTQTRPVDDAAWQYTPIAEWTKPVTGTFSARAILFSYPQNAGPSSGTPEQAWMLGAEGKTPGYALPGC